MMVRRRVADLWRQAATGAEATLGDWATLYQELLAALSTIVADESTSETAIREQLQSLIAVHRDRRPATRAQLVRERLMEGVRPVRSLLPALVQLPWQSREAHPALEALKWLRSPIPYLRELKPSPGFFPVRNSNALAFEPTGR
ncbi:MAG: hypothetical protein JO331_12415 [Verrucomicrobia bacterium]|nr:hypothetical protein [Verrucomicrobiota bacterium]